MLMLSVDSSAKSAAVVVTDDGVLLAEGFENSGFTHSETLLPLVDSTLQKAGKRINEIEAFAVTNGPGSFTGLRIGCAMVKGLAGERPCYPVPTLLALAYNYLEEGCIVIPMMDARRSQTYTATFRIVGGEARYVQQDRAIAVCELEQEMDKLLKSGERIAVLGDGRYLLSEEMKTRVILPEEALIRGMSIAKAASQSQVTTARDLGLRYLRLSQAEREKLNKNGGKE